MIKTLQKVCVICSIEFNDVSSVGAVQNAELHWTSMIKILFAEEILI